MERDLFELLPTDIKSAVAMLAVADTLTDDIALAFLARNNFPKPKEILGQMRSFNAKQDLGNPLWKISECFEEGALKYLGSKVPDISKVMGEVVIASMPAKSEKNINHFYVSRFEFRLPNLRKAAITRLLSFVHETFDGRNLQPAEIVSKHYFGPEKVTAKEIHVCVKESKEIGKFPKHVYEVLFCK